MIDPLKAYRTQHDISQGQLADQLGISRQMVNFLERGEREYTLKMIRRIEKRLGINPHLFLKAA